MHIMHLIVVIDASALSPSINLISYFKMLSCVVREARNRNCCLLKKTEKTLKESFFFPSVTIFYLNFTNFRFAITEIVVKFHDNEVHDVQQPITHLKV